MAAVVSASLEGLPLDAGHRRKGTHKSKGGKRSEQPAEPEQAEDTSSTATSTSTSAPEPAVGTKRPGEEAERPDAKRAAPPLDRLANLENQILLFFDEELQRLGIVDANFAGVETLPPNFAAGVREAFAWLYDIKNKKPEDVRALLTPDSPHPFVALSPEAIRIWWQITCSKPQPKPGSMNNYQCWTEITYGPKRKADKFQGRPWFYMPPMVVMGMHLSEPGWPAAKENVTGEKGNQFNMKPEENLYHLRLDVESPDNPNYNERYRLMGLFGSLQLKRLFRQLMYQLFTNPLFQPVTKRNIFTSYMTSQVCDELKVTQRDGRFYIGKDDDEEEVTYLHELVREGCFERFRTEVTTCTWGETKEIEEEEVRDCKGWARPEKTDFATKCPVFVSYDVNNKDGKKKPDPAEPKEPWPSGGFPIKPEENERIRRCVRQHKGKHFCPLIFRKANGKIAGTNENLSPPPTKPDATESSTSVAPPAAPEDGAAPKYFWIGSGNVVMLKFSFKVYSLRTKVEWGMAVRFHPDIRILSQREMGSLKSKNVALVGEENIHLLKTRFEDDAADEQKMGGFDHDE